MKWANSKGLTKQNMFNLIKKEDANELIDEFKPEFYTEVRRRIQMKDVEWLKNNIDVDAYKDHLVAKHNEELDRIESKAYPGDERQVEYARARDIEKANARFSLEKESSVGWQLTSEITKFPNRAVWESDKWKELHSKGNEAPLAFYNYIRERNQYYADIGYISNPQARRFLPWVRKSFMETIAFDGKVPLGEQFLRNISIDEGEVGYGKLDPITGKPIDELPKYFTTEIQGESTDLFKTMTLYNEMAIKFGYMSEIENQGRALIRLEQNKKAIATSVFGRTSKNEYGELELSQNNVENSKLVEDMVKAIIYQQKYIESETFDMLIGNIGKANTKINKFIGYKLLPENMENRKASINKAITTLNNAFQLKTLGFNPLSSVSNYFGGTANALINSGKYFTKSDFVKTEMWMIANKMGGSDKEMMLAALEYFIPFTESYNRDNAKKISLTKLDGEAFQDLLMSWMRNGDLAIQSAGFYSFFRNSIVQDGKVVNTREWLRTTPEFEKMYEGSEQDRKDKAARFEAEVKRLNETQGLEKIGKVVDGKFVIPGVDQEDESVIELRRKVQGFANDALGSASEENKRLINMTIYGNSFMVFKNWIPRLVDVRMGNLKYNAASDSYEWGRSRMVFKALGDGVIKGSRNLLNSLKANDKGVEYMREVFEKKRVEYENETGKTLDMTEDQFMDLMRQNIRNQIADLIVYAGLFAMFFLLKAIPPDEEEDPKVKNLYKFALKATDKFKDELEYFYNPLNLLALVKSGIFPSVGLINNYLDLIGHTGKELYALSIGDEEMVESNKTVKYWMRTFPFTTQAANVLPLFSPDLAKDLGIKMQSTYGYH